MEINLNFRKFVIGIFLVFLKIILFDYILRIWIKNLLRCITSVFEKYLNFRDKFKHQPNLQNFIQITFLYVGLRHAEDTDIKSYEKIRLYLYYIQRNNKIYIQRKW